MIEIGGLNKKLTFKIRLFFDSLNQNWKSLSEACHVGDPPLLAFCRITCGMSRVILYKKDERASRTGDFRCAVRIRHMRTWKLPHARTHVSFYAIGRVRYSCMWLQQVHVCSRVQLRFEIFHTREITCFLITRRSAKENAIGAILLWIWI